MFCHYYILAYARIVSLNELFVDERAETTTEVGPSGSEHEVTWYSDGSSTVNFGGMGGKVHYDRYGEEC